MGNNINNMILQLQNITHKDRCLGKVQNIGYVQERNNQWKTDLFSLNIQKWLGSCNPAHNRPFKQQLKQQLLFSRIYEMDVYITAKKALFFLKICVFVFRLVSSALLHSISSTDSYFDRLPTLLRVYLNFSFFIP